MSITAFRTTGWRRFVAASCAAVPLLLGAACASRSGEVAPIPADPLAFALWDCERLDAEADRVQARALDVAYAVDSRAGNNVIAMSVGLSVFWPALLAMRGDGPEAVELAELKGRHDALLNAARARGCAPPGADLPARRAARWPVAPGERLVYEDRRGSRSEELVLRLVSLKRDGAEFALEPEGLPWSQDHAGNLRAGDAQFRHFLREGLTLGESLAGEMRLGGDEMAWGRVRGQVMSTGAQTVAERRFDVAVIELFGDVPQPTPFGQTGMRNARVEGVMAIDRESGLLLRLDLKVSAVDAAFRRRLVRVEPG